MYTHHIHRVTFIWIFIFIFIKFILLQNQKHKTFQNQTIQSRLTLDPGYQKCMIQIYSKVISLYFIRKVSFPLQKSLISTKNV